MSENWELPTEEIKEQRRKWTDDEEDVLKVSSKIDGIKFSPKIMQARTCFLILNILISISIQILAC